MKIFHIQVITGYGNAVDAGLTSFTVEAEYFEYSNSGCYRFYNANGYTVAAYPINRTIITKIKEK
mgnify:CR=1 FL=1